MVLIIYGTPIEMYRDGFRETWIYEDIEFDFIKISTLFGSIYALKKDKKYEDHWFKTIGNLRLGN